MNLILDFRETMISVSRLHISINKNPDIKSKFWAGDIVWKALSAYGL